MRHSFSYLAIGLCVLIANPAASASERDRSLSTDMSAAKKKKQVRHERGQYVHVRAVPPGYARRGWMDPSLGPDGRPYPNPYPSHICSSDMGYGRFSTCDFHE
jgi:hypothetical protein